jgi:hypothetical protein
MAAGRKTSKPAAAIADVIQDCFGKNGARGIARAQKQNVVDLIGHDFTRRREKN